MEKEKILVIDDEAVIREGVRRILEGDEFSVETSASGHLALERMQECDFDLVITDMTMPQMAGDRLARQLWDIRPDLPVILCTGYNEMISEDKATAMGIRKFLLKPVDKDELAVAIRAALNSSPPLYLVPRKPLAPLAAS